MLIVTQLGQPFKTWTQNVALGTTVEIRILNVQILETRKMLLFKQSGPVKYIRDLRNGHVRLSNG